VNSSVPVRLVTVVMHACLFSYNHRMYATTTTDFEYWEDISSRLVMPAGLRHGTALEVDPALVQGLRGYKSPR